MNPIHHTRGSMLHATRDFALIFETCCLVYDGLKGLVSLVDHQFRSDLDDFDR